MIRSRWLFAVLALCGHGTPSFAQNPLRDPSEAIEIRFARSQPVIAYRLRVDASDLSGFDVEMRLRNVPDSFRVAMPAHQEYDEEYWRYVERLRVDSPAGGTAVSRVDSALWLVRTRGGNATVSYHVRIPTTEQSPVAAWRPFLAPTGGLLGGPYGLLYVVGAELAPAHVSLDLPAGWQIATGLEPTSDPRTFFASSAGVLVDSPFLVGQLRNWRFAIDDVPYRVVYWDLPNAKSFDSSAFVAGIEAMARQAVTLFGRSPWREYTFLIRDGAYGALEHANSVTLGVTSAALSEDASSDLGERTHEFVHAWNLMRIRPAEYRILDYRPQPPTGGLWWGEGLTLFYADLLLRRAGAHLPDSTRTAHLAGLITRYLASPGASRFSAEAVSRVAYNARPGALGDYGASTHLQGELLGIILDLTVRSATAGRRSMDDVMRLMLERYSGAQGYVGRDIERTVADVCACNVTPIFDAHVRGASPIDFDRYLRLVGLRARVTWAPAVGRDGSPAQDLRLFPWEAPDHTVQIIINDPTSVWGRAGLHSRDQVLQVNGVPIHSRVEMQRAVAAARIGDTLTVEVVHGGARSKHTVVMAGYSRPSVRIEELPDATPAQVKLRAAWMVGRP